VCGQTLGCTVTQMQRETTEATATSAATDAAAADEHVIIMELMAGGNNIGLLRQVSTL
jgi:hypothetical protein